MQHTTLLVATPQVGQGTEETCLGVSSFFFIKTGCDYTRSGICTILDTWRGLRHVNANTPDGLGLDVVV